MVDLSSDKSIEIARETVQSKYGRVDTLINNAGATYDLDYSRGKVSLRDCFNNAYDANVVSNLLQSLLSLLQAYQALWDRCAIPAGTLMDNALPQSALSRWMNRQLLMRDLTDWYYHHDA